MVYLKMKTQANCSQNQSSHYAHTKQCNLIFFRKGTSGSRTSSLLRWVWELGRQQPCHRYWKEKAKGSYQQPRLYFGQNHVSPLHQGCWTAKEENIMIRTETHDKTVYNRDITLITWCMKRVSYWMEKCGINHFMHTCGKQTGIPPRIAFGGLKIAYIICICNQISVSVSLYFWFIDKRLRNDESKTFNHMSNESEITAYLAFNR